MGLKLANDSGLLHLGISVIKVVFKKARMDPKVNAFFTSWQTEAYTSLFDTGAMNGSRHKTYPHRNEDAILSGESA